MHITKNSCHFNILYESWLDLRTYISMKESAKYQEMDKSTLCNSNNPVFPTFHF